MLGGGVVMAGKHRAGAAGDLDQLRPVFLGIESVQFQPLADQLVDMCLGDILAADIEAPPRFEVAELALAGRVVHQRHEMHRMALHERFQMLDDVRRRDLAADMGAVIGAKMARPTRLVDGIGQRLQVGADRLDVDVGTGPERIEHRGDAGCGDLRVIGHHRGERMPAHMRARREMAFEVIGVQFDEAGDQMVARKVDAALRRLALADLGDAAVIHGQPALLDDAVGEHQPGILDHIALRVGHRGALRSDAGSRAKGESGRGGS